MRKNFSVWKISFVVFTLLATLYYMFLFDQKLPSLHYPSTYITKDTINSKETFLSAISEEEVNGNTTLKHFLNSFHDSPRTVKIQSSTTKSVIKRNLPAFMIIGVQKASTTLLALYLQNHPDIIMSVRENHRYDSHYPPEKYQERRTVENFIQTHQNKEFSKLCKLGGEHNTFLCGMRDPAAFFRPNLAIPLLKVFPWRMRFLILLRDPVDRLEVRFFKT
mmetsp:Transcript_38685/g.89884  ORF Transcript_38685/g.89884 Transcript_38685/m.89884 type:complete len:220 (-) Transcript_38685:702-1361(-)